MDTIPLLPDFLDLLKFLNEEKVKYLVIGGMAVNYYGYHRSTGDLDIGRMWLQTTRSGSRSRYVALVFQQTLLPSAHFSKSPSLFGSASNQFVLKSIVRFLERILTNVSSVRKYVAFKGLMCR